MNLIFGHDSRITKNRLYRYLCGYLIGNECVLAKPPAADRPEIWFWTRSISWPLGHFLGHFAWLLHKFFLACFWFVFPFSPCACRACVDISHGIRYDSAEAKNGVHWLDARKKSRGKQNHPEIWECVELHFTSLVRPSKISLRRRRGRRCRRKMRNRSLAVDAHIDCEWEKAHNNKHYLG